ncbi:MAG: lipooligosaccharide transport system permease protein [Chloroflexota bacterium]|jgi:lipooligosaccharide transport system permease protein|nr:lipooligosaccharide transport system permease protein [Chloroflexota bacterium]
MAGAPAAMVATGRRLDVLAVLRLWKPPSVSLNGAVRVWQRNLLLYRRSWLMNILPNFFSPLLYLVSIGIGVGVYIGTQIAGQDYVVFLAPALAGNAAMNGGVFETTYNVYVKLRWSKLYDAVITTPLESEDIATGELMWATTRAVLYGVAFLGVMLVFGMIRSWGALLAPVEFALLGLAFALIGLIFTSLAPSIDLFSYFFTLFVTPLFLFSGTFFPVTNLPVGLQWLAWFSPLFHGSEALRDLCTRGDLVAAAGHSLWLVVACVVLFPPAVNLLRRKLVV